MKIKLPIRNLIIYSLFIAVAMMVFFFIIIYLQELNFISSILKAIFSGIILITTSALSISLIVIFERHNLNDFSKHSKLRFIIGAIVNMLFMHIYRYIRELAEQRGVFIEHINNTVSLHDLNVWQIFLLTFIPSLLIFGLVHLYHNFILLHHFKTQTEIEVSQLKIANAETTNQLLRQQVQPHFLFNTLTILKSLINNNPKTAEAYLIRLSDFLRVSFSQNRKGVTSIKEELKVCEDYLEMQKMRFGEAIEYSFDVPKDYLDKYLPFFSLQMLAENAIKHNKLTDESPLIIQIVARDDVIRVSNNLQRKASVEDTTGYGLTNLSERYKLLSGNYLEVIDDGKFFSVGFKII